MSSADALYDPASVVLDPFDPHRSRASSEATTISCSNSTEADPTTRSTPISDFSDTQLSCSEDILLPPHESAVLRALLLAYKDGKPRDLQRERYDPRDLYHKTNCEQLKHWNDPRVRNQAEWFISAQQAQPPTFYSHFAPIGTHIFDNGMPAQTSSSTRDADFLTGNSKELERWLLEGTGDKLFLLRDTDWLPQRPFTSGSTMLQTLQATNYDNLQVEVQELGKKFQPTKNSVEPMVIGEVIRNWKIRDHSRPPLNLLSLKCTDDGTVPWPLAKHCNLLNQAACFSASKAQSYYYATAGKQGTELISKSVDLQSCMHFQIFGQAGAISSWHMDSIGPYTYITLEPNVAGQPDDHVLKCWAYVRTDHLSSEERDKIHAEFKQLGDDFRPDPALLKVLMLVAGDTLIMPPGTIHAPITITDCLFRGGMVMHKRQMRRSMRAWRFCSGNPHCTNEDQPRQTRSILDFFRNQVRTDPAGCGYNDEEGLREFEDDYKKISGDSLVCRCKAGCNKKKCGCFLSTQRCGIRCHGGVGKCDNPHGCEANEASLVGAISLIGAVGVS
jgi:hypothetical protein